jgi:hypothetical protein
VAEYYEKEFRRKLFKTPKSKPGRENDVNKQKLELVKRLLWPLMGENPRRLDKSSMSSPHKPVVPSWFDTTDSLHLPM